jgi:hypothetical protein
MNAVAENPSRNVVANFLVVEFVIITRIPNDSSLIPVAMTIYFIRIFENLILSFEV